MTFPDLKLTRVVRTAVCVAAALGSSLLHAQNYPDRPVRVIVPFAAGSGADVAARIVTQRLAEVWKQGVVVDNLVGANGLIGTQTAARSTADGYTLLVPNDTVMTVNPALYNKLPYDSVKDFAPIAQIGETPVLLVANAQFPPRNFKEFLDLARQKPGSIDFSSGGVGSTQHLPMEMLMSATGIKLTHVPYKAMTAALSDVVAGQVAVMFSGVAGALPFVESGKLKALAVGSAKRHPLLPNVPTVAESGVPGFRYGSWLGFVAPAGTPPAIVSKISTQIQAVVREPAVDERLQKIGFVSYTTTPEQFKKVIADDLKRYADLIAKTGIEKAN